MKQLKVIPLGCGRSGAGRNRAARLFLVTGLVVNCIMKSFDKKKIIKKQDANAVAFSYTASSVTDWPHGMLFTVRAWRWLHHWGLVMQDVVYSLKPSRAYHVLLLIGVSGLGTKGWKGAWSLSLYL